MEQIMSHHLLDSVAASFREARQNAVDVPLFVCVVASERENWLTQSTHIADKISTLKRLYGRAELAHYTVECTWKLTKKELDTRQKLLNIRHDSTRPQYLRDRATTAEHAYREKRSQTPPFPCLRYTVAKARKGNYSDHIYFGGVDLPPPDLQKYADAAAQSWAICHAEPFATQVGITRPDLMIAEEGERPYVRWIALIFRTLFDAGKLLPDSTIRGIQLYWFPADLWTATQSAIDALATYSGTPRPKWDRATRTLTIENDPIPIASREAPVQFAILDSLEVAGWPTEGVDAPRLGSVKDAVEALNDTLSSTRLRILNQHGNQRIGWKIDPN
jgi:hypothetical protein